MVAYCNSIYQMVVSSLEFSDNGTCQKPLLASSLVNVVAPLALHQPLAGDDVLSGHND